MPRPKPILIEGRRVTLSPFDKRDKDEFIRLNRMSRSPFVTLPMTPERFSSFLERGNAPDVVRLAVRRNEDAAVLGSIEVSQIARGILQSAYLGYQIGSPYEGKGYMSEAMRLMLDFAFGALKLHRLEANIQPKNRSSLALAKRLGFKREGYSPRYLKIGGRWQDHERWAVLKEEWTR
jgi:ribosomal-protein-alanine N-acetyltransferase